MLRVLRSHMNLGVKNMLQSGYKGANPNDVRPIEEDLTAYIPDKKDKKRDAFPTSIVVEEIRFFSSQPPQTIYYNKNHYYGYIPLVKIWQLGPIYYALYKGAVILQGPGANN